MTADARDIIAAAVAQVGYTNYSAEVAPSMIRYLALDEMFHSAGAPEGEAHIVLHRSDDGKVTVEGQAEHVGFVWQSSQGLQWGGPEGTGHQTERPVYRVVPAGGGDR